MKFHTFIPSPLLRPYVKNYWLLEVEKSDCPFRQTILPFGSFELIAHLKDPCQMTSFVGFQKAFFQPKVFYTGQFTKPILTHFNTEARVIAASLHPWAGNLLFNIPAYEFTDVTIDVNLVAKNTNLIDKLQEARNNSELISRLEEYLKPRLPLHPANEISKTIVGEIISKTSPINLKSLLREFPVSRRRLEQVFLETTGLPMGFFMRKIRFQKAVRLLRKFPQENLTFIGLEAGYYDQSHFIRDFREFTNLSPREYLIREFGMKKFIEDLMLVE